MNIEFGVPSQRSKKEEKYPAQVVLTVLAVAEKKGSSKKIAFNKAAIRELGFSDSSKVSVSFAGERIFVVNTTDLDLSESYGITKGSPRTFSNSKVYGYISKVKNLDNSVDNDFELTKIEGDYDGKDIYELNPLNVTDAGEVSNSTDTTGTSSEDGEGEAVIEGSGSSAMSFE